MFRKKFIQRNSFKRHSLRPLTARHEVRSFTVIPSKWDLFFKSLARLELIIGIIAIPIIAIVGFNELESLAEQRRVNAWQLVVHQTEGSAGKTPALEFLNKEHYCPPEWFPFKKCLIEKSDLAAVNLSGSWLFSANLPFIELAHANVSRADLRDADLRGANLEFAVLKKTDLSGANLSKADLTNAELFEADLSGANLTGANLTGANLTRAKVGFADFIDADLSWTNVSNVNFRYAIISVKQLEDACVMHLDDQPLFPEEDEFYDFQISNDCDF